MAAYAALLSLAQATRAQHKSPFSSNAEEKVRSIHDYAKFLLLFFDEFPQKVNRWEGRIRDVAYRIEDVIEFFMWKQIQSRHRVINPSRFKLEDQLENVKEEIGLIAGEVMEERPAYQPSSSSSSRFASTGNDAVIGLDDDIMTIKERLCGHSPNLQVISIVGMGGIGKTTLARTVYDDQLIIESFHIRAWVVVSQDYTPHRFRKILLGLLDTMKLSGEEIEESELALKVYKNLKGRRYLVVVDDVWGTEVWDDLRDMFPNYYNGSRIMLTSRVSDVVGYPNSDSALHQMQSMTDSQSWNLLKQKVFTDNNCPPRLEKVGKEIARKCLGLPIVVVLVAGFLSTVKKSVASWEEISKTVNTFVGQETDKILSLSYTHLPHHLRPCFLFIGGFPEDAKIRASTLIKLWVAEGFLKHDNGCGKSLEEEAEEYLEDLVKRNLVIVTSRKRNGKIKSCSLHDMVRDLCIRKAHQEKFLCVLPQDLVNEPRHLSLNHSHVDYIWGLNIRTILGFQLKNFPSWPAFLKSFRLLRVLDVVGDRYQELPSQLFELFHLRYLALVCSLKIPSAISNLVNLQTLIIGPSFRYWRIYNDVSHFCLPLEIWSMPKLRHLVFYDLYVLPHPPYGSNHPLENLQTLSPVENLVWSEEMVQMIPNIKRLGLVYASNEEYHLHHLKYLVQLEKLQVNGYGDFSWVGKNPNFPRTLKKLTLVGGRFPWEDMSIIGSLPHLQVLKLRDHACHGETWETADGEFPRLEFLQIDGSHLRQWITESSHFPILKSLVLLSCPHLSNIPECIGEIPTLELIEIDGTSLMESAMRIKEDQQSYGNYDLHVHIHSDEEIQSRKKRMDPSPSRPPTTVNDKVSGLLNNLKAIKDQLCGPSSQLQVVPILDLLVFIWTFVLVIILNHA